MAHVLTSRLVQRLLEDSPRGGDWYIEGQLDNNAKCRFRLLKVTFNPFGSDGVSWSGAYSLPIGGSLPNTFVIDSEQVREHGAIVYGGITSGNAVEVEAKTRSGKWVSIETQAPQMATPPIWLRNLRYFIEYLPGDEKVERVRVRDKAGGILYQGAESVLGIFQELGVL